MVCYPQSSPRNLVTKGESGVAHSIYHNMNLAGHPAMDGSQYYDTLQRTHQQKQRLNLHMNDEHYEEAFFKRKNITAQTDAMIVSTGGNHLQPTHPMFAHFDRLSDTFRPSEPL